MQIKMSLEESLGSNRGISSL